MYKYSSTDLYSIKIKKKCHLDISKSGGITIDMLIRKVSGGIKLQLNYQEISVIGELMLSYCESTPEMFSTDRIRLFEQ